MTSLSSCTSKNRSVIRQVSLICNLNESSNATALKDFDSFLENDYNSDLACPVSCKEKKGLDTILSRNEVKLCKHVTFLFVEGVSSKNIIN